MEENKLYKETIEVNNLQINILSKDNVNDFISLTDLARYKNSEFPKDVIKNWMRNRSTIEFLGLWEMMHNPTFKGVDFDTFVNEAGSNSKAKGNIRDNATITQLIVLANLENLNATFIKDGLPQKERLIKLNNEAISQLTTFENNSNIKK